MANKIHLAILILSLPIYSSTTLESKEGLFSQSQMEAICELQNPSYVPTQSYSSLEAYVESMSTRFGKGKLVLLGTFFEGVMKDLKGFLKEIIASVITLSFAVLALISK